jgi:hypothetical protein
MEVRKKAGEKGAAATSLGFGRAPSLFFYGNVSLFFFFVGFLVMTSLKVFSHSTSFKICIYSARVPSHVRNQVSIKLILFFEV